MSDFIGRDTECGRLKDLAMAGKSSVTVLYGRRRVGKTELIRRAFAGMNALYFEGLENQSKSRQIANFISQLSFQTRQEPGNPSPRRWYEAFRELIPHVKGRKTVIVFDEFQWMANYRSEIVSDLKMVWEQYLKDSAPLTLILCGSIASFMIDKVIKSSAFYGRTDLVIHVTPFKLRQTAEMLAGRSTEEIVEAQMLLGGIPKYLELIKPESSVILGMQHLGFTPHAYFVEEYGRIFLSHFGRNRDYKKIIEALADHPYGLSHLELCGITKILKGGGLTGQLSDMESAGFIRSFPPFDRDSHAKNRRHCLIDPYLRFYWAFIRPALEKIKMNRDDIFLRMLPGAAYASWLGRAFEYLCLDHAKEISGILGFSGIDFNHGPYYRKSAPGKPGVQIDLIFDRADRVITLCEMKYSQNPCGLELIRETEKKVAVLQTLTKKTVQRVLITKSLPTRELVNRGYFYKVILARELMDAKAACEKA